MLSIGMDVHQNNTALCILDSEGRLKAEKEVRGGFKAVAETLAGLRQSLDEPFACATRRPAGTARSTTS